MQKRKKNNNKMLILYVCVGQILLNVTFLSFFPNNSFNRQLSFKVDVMNHIEMMAGGKIETPR